MLSAFFAGPLVKIMDSRLMLALGLTGFALGSWKRLMDFWESNTTQTYPERLFNDAAIQTLELASKGHIPLYNLSPYSSLVKTWMSFATAGLRSEFTDLEKLLKHHIDFAELTNWGPQPEPPILIVGSCNILTGKLHKFNSRKEAMKVEHILASACVPNIFPAVSIEEMAYWDGLFSDNPPIAPLIKRDFVGVENMANEIWVIKINPTTTDRIPVTPDDIADRRNELEGNVSLFQSLSQVEDLNNLFLRGAFTQEFLAEINVQEPIKIPKLFPEDPDREFHIPMIEMSAELAKTLNYESKLDRSPEMIHRLIEDGEKQGKTFVKARLGI